MRPFSLLVKPASADCNIECEYCFYLEKKNLYPGIARHKMSTEILETMIRKYFQTPQPNWTFGWQGGEPTLMGGEFFERAIELQKRYAPPGAHVSNGLQTNGTLLDDAFAKVLARGKYLVGISIDGPAEIHDRYRRTVSGGGSHRDVLRGLEALRGNGVEYNVLTLVSKSNVDRPREVYRYLRELGVEYHQYIPCVEFEPDGSPRSYSISGTEWGRFLNEIFDEWFAGDTRRVSVRNFDTVVSTIVQGVPGVCTAGTHCRQYFVVEHNGDVYPCDFFVQPEKRLGNVLTDQFLHLWRSPSYRAFGRAKREWNPVCGDCEFLHYCAGDCPKNRYRQDESPGQLSVLCEGWKEFYGHTLPRFEELARSIRRPGPAVSR
jgi:uncharacterized protein